MLSVSMISTGARAVASMMSPEKNPCRVKDATSNWYRYDPYMSKVMPSPLKTQMISPVKNSSSVPSPAPLAACDSGLEFNESGLHRNSLFNTPMTPPPQVERPQQQFQLPPQALQQQAGPSSFLAAVEKMPVPVDAVNATTTTTMAPTKTESAKTHYAIVYSKHDSRTFIAPFRISTGDHVIVEGDRGFDIGVVGDITTVAPAYNVPAKIIRRATAKDMEAFEQKQRKEKTVTAQIQAMANSLDVGAQIADTEFQFDNNKLTVYVEGKKQIDFRKLQRNLFREHRCRIWVSYMAEIEYNAKLQKVRRTK